MEAFSSRVAHDILNPLGAVSLALALMQREGTSPTVLERARAALQRAVRIVDGLFLFAKAGAQPEPGASCEVQPVVTDTITGLGELATRVGASLRVEGQLDCEVACHPGVLASLLSNRVSNALKYLGEAVERRVVIRVSPRAAYVRFEVEDTGSGIPSALGERVFEPYVRGGLGPQPGLGLGLATVRKLCQAHGGRVGRESHAGRGALFWFELPSPWDARPVPVPPLALHSSSR